MSPVALLTNAGLVILLENITVSYLGREVKGSPLPRQEDEHSGHWSAAGIPPTEQIQHIGYNSSPELMFIVKLYICANSK